VTLNAGVLGRTRDEEANPPSEPGWDRLDRAIDAALRPVRGQPVPAVVLFSGGIDSGLLAWELRLRPHTSLFTVGVAGSDDLDRARETAPLVGLPWEGRTLTDADLAEVERVVEPALLHVPGPRRGIFVAFAAAVALAPAGLLLCGQGVDELFLGYAHFRGLSAGDAARRSEADLATLVQDDWPTTLRISALWRRDIVAPYLDPPFVDAASEVPIDQRLPRSLTKPYFRRWVEHRGAPQAITGRPKRALQYGSGVDRWMRRRRRGTA